MLIPIHTRYTDYDTKGHVNNAIYLTYFEMARAHAWREMVLRIPASRIAHPSPRADEPLFILAEATVRYVSAAMIGESLEIEIRIAEIRTKAWVWEYLIRCVDDGRTIAEGKTAQVWFDYEARKSVPIPEEMRTALEAMD
jgi:acyl-CoA thioester hydrolase